MNHMDVSLRGVRTHYEHSGRGRPVVLLHGWGASGKTWGPIRPFLERHFATYTLDLPGFGQSDEPPRGWTLDDYAESLEEFIAHLALCRVILIGHSFGGRVIVKLGARRQADVSKAVLIDSAGIRPKRGLRYYFRVYTYKTLKSLFCLPVVGNAMRCQLEALRHRFGSDDYRQTSPTMRQVMVKVVNEDLTALLPYITFPVLLVWGENDTVTPLSDAHLMERLIPDAGLVVLENAGHWSYLERCQEFLQVLRAFLKADL